LVDLYILAVTGVAATSLYTDNCWKRWDHFNSYAVINRNAQLVPVTEAAVGLQKDSP